MRRNNPRRAGAVGAEYSRLAGELYKAQSTATAPNTHPIRPGSIVTVDLLPGTRLEVIEVHGTAATLRLANGARLRIGLHRLEVVG